MDGAELSRLGSSMASVYVYPRQISCSSVTLSQLQCFMVFNKEDREIPLVDDVDINPFLYDNKALQQLAPSQGLSEAVSSRTPPNTGPFTWIRDPLSSWGWDEAVWNAHLVACFKAAPAFKVLTICEAFTWSPTTFRDLGLGFEMKLNKKKCEVVFVWETCMLNSLKDFMAYVVKNTCYSVTVTAPVHFVCFVHVLPLC